MKSQSRRRYWYSVLSAIHTHNERKKLLFHAMFVHIGNPIPRSVWKYEREEFWWQRMWANRANDDYQRDKWNADFRMKGSTLSKLVDLMTPFLEKAVTTFRLPIPVHTQVAISV